MKYSFLHACFHNAWLCFCCIRLFCTVGAVTVISPLELIRTKMQSKKFSYEELHRFVSKKVSEDGWISLWRGWAPTILRDQEEESLSFFLMVFQRDDVQGQKKDISGL